MSRGAWRQGGTTVFSENSIDLIRIVSGIMIMSYQDISICYRLSGL